MIITDTKILSQKSKAINCPILANKIGKELAKLITTSQKPNSKQEAIGLAAIQIGEPYRIMVIKPKGVITPFIACNLQILEQEGQYKTKEVCMSLPNATEVTRAHKIKVQYWEPDNVNNILKARTREFKGL